MPYYNFVFSYMKWMPCAAQWFSSSFIWMGILVRILGEGGLKCWFGLSPPSNLRRKKKWWMPSVKFTSIKPSKPNNWTLPNVCEGNLIKNMFINIFNKLLIDLFVFRFLPDARSFFFSSLPNIVPKHTIKHAFKSKNFKSKTPHFKK